MSRETGFTLVEILAVLVILGIIAAFAVPSYINIAAQSRQSAAEAQVAEMKSTLNLAYARLYIRTGQPPTVQLEGLVSVIEEAGFLNNQPEPVGVSPDRWIVKLVADAAISSIRIHIEGRGGDTVETDFSAEGLWRLP